MDLKKLLGLRPKTDSVEEVAAALDRARAALAKAREDEAVLLGGRADLLLAGDAAAVSTGEADLARVRVDIERAEAMLKALEGKLAEAQRAARIGQLRAKIAEATTKAERAKHALAVRYPELAAVMVREVLSPEVEAIAAIHEAWTARDAAMREGLIPWVDAVPDEWALPEAPLPALVPPQPFAAPRPALGLEVKLPALSGRGFPSDNSAPIWPEPRQ